MAGKFNIGATSVLNDGTLGAWLLAPLTEDLEIVPGIGPANKAHFVAAGVKTPFQLLGQFLLLKQPGENSQQHLNAVYSWLAEIKVNSQRAVIALALAEKAKTMMPSIFNNEELDPAKEK